MESCDSNRSCTACPWTLGLSAAMLLFNLGLFSSAPSGMENLLTWLEYDRSAILQGQPWRLLTGNLVHWSAEHFLLDIGAFLVVGFLYERSFGRYYPLMLLLTGLFVGVSALILLPEMATYRGLSGVDSGQFCAALCLECGLAARNPRQSIFLFPAAGIFIVKVLYECLTGQMFFGTELLGDLGQPQPLAHAAGAIGAVVFFGLRILLRCRANALPVCAVSTTRAQQSRAECVSV